jgi:hypothetical protein
VGDQPSGGTASIDPATGAWIYTPAGDFNGSDSFTVTITDDDGHPATQVINLTVNPVDDPVTIGGDVSGSGDEDAGNITGMLTASDAADGLTDGTIFNIEVGDQPSGGTASIDPATGAWIYTPAGDFNGSDSFTVTITDDDGHPATQVINLTVNQVDDPGTFGGATSETIDQNTLGSGTLTFIDVVDGATNPNFMVMSDAVHGTAVIDAVTGAWTYTPVATFHGSDTFIVSVMDDDGNVETQVLTITVNPLFGDFVSDGLYNCDDINALTAVIAASTNQLQFDLTGDALVDLADRDAWLAIAGAANLPSGNPYLLGDADLNGVVDFLDFNIWAANRFTSDPSYCSGDFDASGVIDFLDFNIWAANRFQSSLLLAPPTVAGEMGQAFSMVEARSQQALVDRALVDRALVDRALPSMQSAPWRHEDLGRTKRSIHETSANAEQAIDEIWAKWN